LRRAIGLLAIGTLLVAGGCAPRARVQFAYATDAINNIRVYTVDATSGALTPVAGSPFAPGTEPSCITFARPQ